MSELLLEVGVEEIPAWMIEPALEQLRIAIGNNAQVFGTPRRLVAYVPDMPEAQPDTEEQLTGPPKKAPQQAADAFAKKCGVSLAKLATITTPKGEYWSYLKKEKGHKTADVLRISLPTAILGLHWPKKMYWTSKSGARFIRPIRSILALFGGKVVKFEIGGVKSGDSTFGHRVLGKKKIKVANFEQYKTALAENGVILDAAERRKRIASAELASGEKVRPNPELVETLVYLTEFPTAAVGEFDPSYLTLPEEVLSTVMAHHQKYLSVETADGKLAPKFVFVMNRGADESGIVRHGNERVLRARFNDARFFWDTDQKIALDQRVPMLDKVTFHAKLGTYGEKIRRVEQIARAVAQDLGAEEAPVVRATELCKCDLTTELVKEFTELQGKIGGLYARHQHEGEKVALAIYDHYLPESVDDRIPRTLEGATLSIADKLDTLVSCFRIGMRPSGSKDPFALRRAAQGVMLIMSAKTFAAVQIERHAQKACWDGQTPDVDPREVFESLIAFFNERVRFLLERTFTYDVVNAVMDKGPFVVRPYYAAERAKAIVKLRESPDFDPFIAGYKRIKNILVKAGFPLGGLSYPDPAIMEDGAERGLWEAAEKVHREIEELGDSPDYSTVLGRMPELRPHIDLFFEKVMVMADDERVRRNRLILLAFTIYHFARVADFSEIVTT